MNATAYDLHYLKQTITDGTYSEVLNAAENLT